jgi:rubrerythrin
LTDVVNLLKEQKKIELGHVEHLSKSMEELKHPMVRVVLESIIHDSRKHAAIAQALIDVEAGAIPTKLDIDMGPAVSLHQNIKQHVRVEEDMIKTLGEIIALVKDDRVKSFLDYWVAEEKRHHKMLSELSNLIDRDSVSLDEYVDLFQKYMIVPPE